MASIYFVSTYKPILCGIADYLKFLLRGVPREKWKIISFNLKKFQNSLGRLTCEKKENPKQAWYGITNRRSPFLNEILEGIKNFQKKDERCLLWFQHSFGIWKNLRGFARLLRELSGLKIKKIVSLHTIHFQSKETSWGMEKREYNLLKAIFPWVDAITVFSRGSYLAIKKAFPQYINKTYILRHGIHYFPRIIKMSKDTAKRKIYQFLIEKSNLEEEKKSELKKENIFFDPEILIIGNAGFVAPHKNTEKLFLMRNYLQKVFPQRKVVALYIGTPREKSKKELKYLEKLKKMHDGKNIFFLETWLPEEFLPLFQRALDINFYWPKKCTQSGILAHILGTGSLIAGRDMEGSGEMLKEAGQIVDKDFGKLIFKIKKVISNPNLLKEIEKKTLKYAKKYSWENQALKHYKLADYIFSH
ncbi:MAG: hypothetical protein QME57_02625 [Patescibacteria group bacterium]|nr:hypothetical protein [Patescibacteria group bacterium]